MSEEPAVWDTMVYIPTGTPVTPSYAFSFSSNNHPFTVPEREMTRWDWQQIRDLAEEYLLRPESDDIEDRAEVNQHHLKKISRAIARRFYSRTRVPYHVVPIRGIGVVRVQGTAKNPVHFLDLDYGKHKTDDDVQATIREIEYIIKEYRSET